MVAAGVRGPVDPWKSSVFEPEPKGIGIELESQKGHPRQTEKGKSSQRKFDERLLSQI